MPWSVKPVLAGGIAYDTCTHCHQTIFTRDAKRWYHENLHGVRNCDLLPHRVLFKNFYWRAAPTKKRTPASFVDATPRVGR